MKKLNKEPGRRGEDREIARSGHRDIGYGPAASLRYAFLMFRAVLREIFDESAYERFLARTRSSRSVASYRQFLRERETTITRRPRCC